MDIKIDGIENLEKWLQERMDKIRDVDKLQDDIGIMVQEEIDSNFENEKGPDGAKWQEWSPVTEEYRARHGKEFGKKLNYNNDLRMAVTYETTETSIKAGVLRGPKYSRIHQLGGYAGRGKKVYIPARPYVGLSVSLSNKIIRLVEEQT